jgi:hypothetical protein
MGYKFPNHSNSTKDDKPKLEASGHSKCHEGNCIWQFGGSPKNGGEGSDWGSLKKMEEWCYGKHTYMRTQVIDWVSVCKC